MGKHPNNRYERMKINEKKNQKREDIKRKRQRSDSSVSVSDEDIDEQRGNIKFSDMSERTGVLSNISGD